jgi:tetratricopeptide (TPR) repeat protein
LAGLAGLAGCGTTLSSGETSPPPAKAVSDLPPGIRNLHVRIAEEVAIVVEGSVDPGFSEQLKTALYSELGRLGLAAVQGGDKGTDLILHIETRVTGAVNFMRGHVRLTAEKGGQTVALGATAVELHRSSEFSTLMTQKALSALLKSPALTDLARSGRPGPNVKPRVAAEAAPARATRNVAAEAKARSSRGTNFYNVGRFKEALADYEAAYLAVQDPPFLFNIAQCHRKLGHNKEALDAYRSYLRVAPAAPNRAEVQKHISELERHANVER